MSGISIHTTSHASLPLSSLGNSDTLRCDSTVASTQILHLIDTWGAGGAELMMLNLVTHLPPSYRAVVGLREMGWLGEQCAARQVPVRHIPKRRTYDAGFLTRLIRLIRTENVQLIHAHLFGMNFYGALAAAITKVPMVATVHGRRYDLEKWRRRLTYRLIGRLSNVVVAVCESVRQGLIQHAGLRPQDVRVIYNGIDCARYARTGKPLTTPVVFDNGEESDSGPLLLTASRLSEEKGLSTLLQAVRILREKSHWFHLLILGDGPLRSALEWGTKDLGLEEAVTFGGFCEDLRPVLWRADVYVSASETEGLSLALLEAMAAGLPIVATAVGGNPELVDHRRTGLLVPPRQPQALAEALETLITQSDLRREMARAAQKLVQTRFDLSRMVAEYHKLYQELLACSSHYARRADDAERA